MAGAKGEGRRLIPLLFRIPFPGSTCEHKRRLWLRSRQAELTRVGRPSPRRMILAKNLKAFRNFSFTEPANFSGGSLPYRSQPLGPHELHSSRAILANVGNQGERASRGNVKLPAPTRENYLIVREQSPEKRIDLPVAMLRDPMASKGRAGRNPPPPPISCYR